ncbi:MAG TPA: DUF6416 domain-containing protein [Solirubrobacteraceae bacterium]|nr:DUF6416 domain-containing protein [Solirubrobacteraceae bacterium]
MAEKQITVAVPEERVPEFYAWFADFLTAEPGTAPSSERGRHGRRGHRRRSDASAWSAEDGEKAAWLYRKLAPPARELFDLLLDAPGERFGGEMIARRLGLEKGAHGVAGILAWPGRYSRHLDRVLPIDTEGRTDGGTDYYIDPDTAAIFAAAREHADPPRRRELD